MKYHIPQYSKDRSSDIGLANLLAIDNGSGAIKFTGVYIHLAPVCNFRCRGCFTHMETDRVKRLDFDAIKQITQFAKLSGAETIVFAGAGEPTMDPEFKKIINFIWQSGLKTTLFTNMTQIKSQKEAEMYLENGSVVGKLFTLDSVKYNFLTGNQLASPQAMKGLDYLLKARDVIKKNGKDAVLAIDSYVTKDNWKDLPNLLRFCRHKQIIPYFEAFIELGQPAENIKKMALSSQELTKIFLGLKTIDREEFKINTPIKPGSRNYGQDPCNKATHMFCVKETGKVYMCVCTLREVGSIYDRPNPLKSLQSIFNAKNKRLIDYLKCDHCSKMVGQQYC